MQEDQTETWPYYASDEMDAVCEVLQSGKVNYWTGEKGRQFESRFAEASGCEYGVALANGTLALELALKCLEIEPGDEVIVPSYTFVASASSVALQGATPVFADVEPSLTICPESIESKVTPKTRAIVAVHLLGYPSDMDAILAVAKRHNLQVIEDCAQAHGASYKGKPVGSMGDVAAFSFCQDKIMTTGGEGGMLLTNDEDIWKRAWSYKDHGKNPDALKRTEGFPGFSWVHDSIGTNWRMTEMQSAIGLVQLGKLEDWVATRRRNAQILDETFADFDTVRPDFGEDRFHSFYRYGVQIDEKKLLDGWSRDRLVAELNEKGVVCASGICPEVYLEKAFNDEGIYDGHRLPNAMQCGERSIQFPVYPTLLEETQRKRAGIIHDLLSCTTHDVYKP